MKNKVISLIVFLFIVTQFVLSIVVFLTDETIPIHWNLYGEIDAYGSSSNIFIITSINIASYIFLRWLSLHPEFCNFPRPFKNRDIAFKNMSSLLRWVELYVSAIILYITTGTISHNLYIYIIYILVICLIITTIVGINKLSKS